jgi:hypothetical protein
MASERSFFPNVFYLEGHHANNPDQTISFV